MDEHQAPLPSGLRRRTIDNGNGLLMHVLEAGCEGADRPCVLLLHGFPELAYSWRKIMPALAEAGFHVVAPDQRGYGRSTGWDGRFDGDVGSFGMLNLAKDARGLVAALGRSEVAAVVGHDFGSPVAAWCALLWPEVFRSVALMSAPFAGPPAMSPRPADIHTELAALAPPRKHYQWYYSGRQADADMRHAAQGVHDFLRAYYHVKSADLKANAPYALKAWTATELAQLPRYYVMDLHQDMAQTVAPHMPSPAEIAVCAWLPDAELREYTRQFSHTGFQGGLQWYRCATDPQAGLAAHAGRRIEVPACFIAGASDWGVHQVPGAVQAMQTTACTQMRGVHLVPGAGHWVQQEQPERTAAILLRFLQRG